MQEGELVANAEKVMGYMKFTMLLLSLRVLTGAALLLGSVATFWALAYPDWMRLAVAMVWWPMVYLPILFLERKTHV
jgi:hypothetical protein